MKAKTKVPVKGNRPPTTKLPAGKTVVRVPKRRGKTAPKKLTKKQLDKLNTKKAELTFKKTVLLRDGYKCALCGDKNPKGKTAHHWYVGQTACPALKYDPSNGVAMCHNYCHRIVVHKQGAFEMHNQIRKVAVERIGMEAFIALQEKARQTCRKVSK